MHFDECAVACEPESGRIRPCVVSDTATAEALARVALSRMARARLNQGGKRLSCGASHANAFCCLLVGGSAPDCLKMIAKLEAQCLSYAVLVDQLFAPAARELGRKWNDSDLSFSEVSIGISTLFRVHATLRSRTAQVSHGLQNHILFVTQPHQAHSLGITLAAEAFRRRGWDVEMLLNAAQDTVVDHVSKSQVQLVGVTAGCEKSVDALSSLCARLSELLRPPVVLLGGLAVHSRRAVYPEACIRIQGVEDALRHAERASRFMTVP